MVNQLALEVRVQTENQDSKTLEQRKAFEDLLAKIRLEASEQLAIAQDLFPEKGFSELRSIPNAEFCEIMQIYYKRHPERKPQCLERPPQLPKPAKPYIPHTKERKQRNRTRLLLERVKRQFSFPEFWIEKVQNELLSNPEYYGICPLPGSIAACKLNAIDYDPARLAAIAKEQELRLIEAGLQPVRIPLNLKTPEKALEASRVSEVAL